MDYDPTIPKPGSKAGETTLGILGTVLSMAGPILGIPGLDLGAPLKAGAASMAENRMHGDLIKLFSQTTQTANMAKAGQALINAGGVIPNMDLANHPDVQDALTTSGILPGEQGGMDQTPEPSPTLPPPPITGPLSVRSPEFLARAAVLAPDLATKIALSQATENPITAALQALQLQNYEKPEEKRAAQQEDRMATMKATQEMINQGQKSMLNERNLDKIAAYTPKEQEQITLRASNLSFQQNLLGRLGNVNLNPTVMAAIASTYDVSQGLYQRVMSNDEISQLATKVGLSPQDVAAQIQVIRDLGIMVQRYVKESSGVQYGFKELTWLQSLMPSKWDTPDMLQYALKSIILKTKWDGYLPIMAKAKKLMARGSPERASEILTENGITADQVKAFNFIEDRLSKVGTAGSDRSQENIFANIKYAPYLQTLGMDHLLPTLPTQ